MTAKELIDILQSDDGLWLDVKVVDWAGDEIDSVLLKSDGIRIADDSWEI